MSHVETATVMVTVKAYPQLSRKSGEVVCIAGIRLDTPTPECLFGKLSCFGSTETGSPAG